MARVKGILDEEEGRLRPFSLLVSFAAGALSCAIVYNALFHQQSGQHSAADGPATTVVQLKYDAQVEDVQRELLALNLYSGPVNGLWGNATRDAIQTYQQMSGLPKTGQLTPELLAQIKLAHKMQTASRYTGSVSPAALPASGPVVYDAARQAAENKTQVIKKAQVALASLGYEIKNLDGTVNPETRAAILKYQMDNGLDMGGTVNEALLKSLKVK